MEETKLARYIRTHEIKIAGVARAIGLASRSDFHNRMREYVSPRGQRFHFTEEQKQKIAAFLRADISELF
jgi:hypothetical protein